MAFVLLSQVGAAHFCEANHDLSVPHGTGCATYAQRLVDSAAMGLLFGVFGCTVAAIELIGVGAERYASARSMAISVCARASFVVSLAATFSGLATVSALSFDSSTLRLAQLISIGWDVAVPSVLGFVYVEVEPSSPLLSRTYKPTTVSLRRFFNITGAGFAALAAGIAVRAINGSTLATESTAYVGAVFTLGIALIVLGMIGVLAYGRRPTHYGMPPAVARSWIAACCVFMAGLMQLLPS